MKNLPLFHDETEIHFHAIGVQKPTFFFFYKYTIEKIYIFKKLTFFDDHFPFYRKSLRPNNGRNLGLPKALDY